MANLTKDQRIIKDNPNATPHELLLLGLSQSKYEELTATEQKEAVAPIQQTREERIQTKVKPVVRAIPKIDAAAPVFAPQSDMVWLIDKTGKTRPMRITRKQGERQVRKYPKEFEIKP